MNKIIKQAIGKPHTGKMVTVYSWWDDGTMTRRVETWDDYGVRFVSLDTQIAPIEWNNRDFGPLVDTVTGQRIAE